MDRKSKVLLTVITLGIVASIGCSFYRYMVKQDFVTFTDENAVPGPWDIFNINQ